MPPCYVHLGATERQPDRFLHRQAQVVLANVAEDKRDEGGVRNGWNCWLVRPWFSIGV